jgi:hypothetical protein
MLDADCSVTLITHPLSWAEIGQQYRQGKAFFEFDQVWRPLLRQGPAGIEPYPLFEAVRKVIRGVYSAPSGFKGGALDALVDVLPHGDFHLFTRELGFVGRFASFDDAQMIGKAMKAVRPVIFSTAEEFLELGAIDQGVVLIDLDPSREWPAKFKLKDAMGVLEMAKAKTKTKAKKVEKAEAKQKRADGPVAKARAIFEQMRTETDSSAIIKACEAAGVNRGTATTQLGRWRKEEGIVVKRGGARKKAEATGGESANPEASPKSGKKKKGKKKKEPAAAAPAIPASSAKGEKRHKPKSSKSTGSSSTKAENPSEPSPEKKAASDPAAPATASSPSPTATTASGSPAASTPTGAPSSATGSAPKQA